MKKKYFIIFYLFIMMIAIFPKTNAKYVGHYKGLAWNTTFSDFTIKTDTVIVDSLDEKESEELWGSNVSGSESDSKLDMLKNVEFSIMNLTDKPILVSFKIEYALSLYLRNLPIEITNITTKDTLYATLVDGADQNGEIDHNDTLGNWEYKCKPTLDPTKMLSIKGDTNSLASDEIILRSFVLEKGESATYAFTADYSGLAWFSDFKFVKFAYDEYTG